MAKRERTWGEFFSDLAEDPIGETKRTVKRYVVEPAQRQLERAEVATRPLRAAATEVIRDPVGSAKRAVRPLVEAVKPYVEPAATAVSNFVDDPVGTTSQTIRDGEKAIQSLTDRTIDSGFELLEDVTGVDSTRLRETFNQSAGTALTAMQLAVAPGYVLTTNPNVRGAFGETARDFVRDVVGTLTWLGADSWRTSSGDQSYSDWASQGVEDLWDDYIKPATGSGEFEFRMATGFEAKIGMMYNGQKLTEARAEQLIKEGYLVERVNPDGSKGYEVSAFLSIYLKNNNGSTEILDNRDPRFNDLVGPYMSGQVGTMFLGGWLSKSGGAAGWINRGITASDIGGVALAGYEITQPLLFKPEAVRELAKAFQNPSSLNPERLRELTNTIFYPSSHKEGPWAGETYIPSLKGKESPYERLAEMASGGINVHRRETPFESFDTDRQIQIVDTRIQQELLNNKYFQKAYYDLAARALSGERLSDPEIFSLRFSLGIMTGENYDLKQGKYSAQDRQQTVDAVRQSISDPSNANQQPALIAQQTSAYYGQEIQAEERAQAAAEKKSIQDGLRGAPGSGGMIFTP